MEYPKNISPIGQQEVHLTSFEATVFLENCTLRLLFEKPGGLEAHYVVENGSHEAEQVVIPGERILLKFTAKIGLWTVIDLDAGVPTSKPTEVKIGISDSPYWHLPNNR